MKTTALAQYYGSNRINAERVGELLKGCEWCGLPFAGGMCEVPYIKARTIVANDLHRGIVNLAWAVSNHSRELQAKLRKLPFHPDLLSRAQLRLAEHYDSGQWGESLGIAIDQREKP